MKNLLCQPPICNERSISAWASSSSISAADLNGLRYSNLSVDLTVFCFITKYNKVFSTKTSNISYPGPVKLTRIEPIARRTENFPILEILILATLKLIRAFLISVPFSHALVDTDHP